MRNLTTFFKSSNLLKPIVVICLSLFVVSCSTDNESVIQEEQLSIIDVLDSFENETEANSSARNANRKPTFKTLKVALAKTGLAGTVGAFKALTQQTLLISYGSI